MYCCLRQDIQPPVYLRGVAATSPLRLPLRKPDPLRPASALRVSHPFFARLYPRMSEAMDRSGMAEHRHQLLVGLTGHVLEAGAGNGDNFGHYPPSVERVTAVEPEAHLRHLAQHAAQQAAVPINVIDGVAEGLPVADESIDAVVVSFVLCTIPDPYAALCEIHRVLRPGGQLRFLEHVRADSPGLARVQHALDVTVWPLLAGGCHTGRDTAATIARAGFRIDRLDRFLFPRQRSPISFHIHGTASRL